MGIEMAVNGHEPEEIVTNLSQIDVVCVQRKSMG